MSYLFVLKAIGNGKEKYRLIHELLNYGYSKENIRTYLRMLEREGLISEEGGEIRPTERGLILLKIV